MWYLIKAYFRFLWHSKNEHAVHSPFVFKLVTQCFYDRKPKAEYAVLKDFRNALLRNQNSIEVTDFGAGSRVFPSNIRKVNAIAQNAGITSKRAELLCRITQYFAPEHILEIGTSVGLATSALSVGNPKAKITTLEGCAQTAQIAQEYFEQFELKNIHTEVTEFSDYFKNRRATTDHEQLIYFDGNHSKAATLQYFEWLLPTAENDSVWIFDDIHWSADMEAAWEVIKNHPKVSVSIDTFSWGIVFFRREQPKEHFTIRV